jgi:anti-anti-sigma factor
MTALGKAGRDDPAQSGVKNVSNLMCQTTQQDKGFVLKLTGQLLLADTEEFDAQINQIFDQKPDRLVIDMSGLSAIGSAGLGALLKAQLRSQKLNCELRLSALQKNIEDVIRSARLDTVLNLS